MTIGSAVSRRLLIDSNLLVLFAVGLVSRRRIEQFKRTHKYTGADFDLLAQVIEESTQRYTLPHILAEVSNLTDLSGPERSKVRETLKQTISVFTEVQIASARAAEDSVYEDLGLVDAAIAAVAREHKCTVLTDDLDLYLMLQSQQIDTLYFTYLRAQALGS